MPSVLITGDNNDTNLVLESAGSSISDTLDNDNPIISATSVSSILPEISNNLFSTIESHMDKSIAEDAGNIFNDGLNKEDKS